MGTNDGGTEPPKDDKGETPPIPSTDPYADRVFKLDLGNGFDEAFETLKDRASHYVKRGQHTQVRIKFRGKEVATLPLPMLLAVEAATFFWTGPLRLLVANALGRTFMEVEFINDADEVVEA